MLERYLDERRDDRDADYMAVQWLYIVHAAGARRTLPFEGQVEP